MMRLTINAVRAARPKDRAYKLPDGKGLYLHVLPTGNRAFRLRYLDPVNGREQTLTLGLWPAVTLDQARVRRETARTLLAQGIDPRPLLSKKHGRNFASAARAWHAHRAPGWSLVHSRDVLTSLERDVFPAIGDRALDAIGPADVLAVLRDVEHRGALETARRIRQRIAAVYEFAREEGWTTAAGLVGTGVALANARGRFHHSALQRVDEIKALCVALDAIEALPMLKLGNHFLAFTAVRLAALRGARWSEMEALDGPAPIWRVPAMRMKLKVIRKANPANDHLVPLSPQAVEVLRRVRALSGSVPDADALVFTGRRGASSFGEGALGELYARAGYAGRHVPHGWRVSFSTIMNELWPSNRGAISRALGHRNREMSNVELAYNRAQHLELRREIMHEWSALIGP